MANNISFNHTLEEYNKKYRNRRYRLLKITKKEVEDFDKKNPTNIKGYLLKDRKWWLIGDTYYEIPRPIRYTWFRNLNAACQVGTCVLAAGVVATAITIPTILFNQPGATQIEVILDSKSEGVTIKSKEFDDKGNAVIKLEAVESSTKEINEVVIKKGEATLKEGSDFTFDDETQTIIIKKEILEKTPGNIVITAKAETKVERVTVTFDTNGGSKIEPIKVKKGKTLKKPDDPIKKHSYFSYWCSDTDLKHEFDFTSSINDNITLFARWSDITHQVEFITNGGYEIIEPLAIVDGNKIDSSKILTPTNDKKTFVSWCDDESLGHEFDFNTEITKPIKLYAKWEAKNIIVKGDHHIEAINYDSGEAASVKPYLQLTTADGNPYSATRWEVLEGEKAVSKVDVDANDSSKGLITLSHLYTYGPEGQTKKSECPNGGSAKIRAIYNDPVTSVETSQTFELSVGTFNYFSLLEDKTTVTYNPVSTEVFRKKPLICIPEYYWEKNDEGYIKRTITRIKDDSFSGEIHEELSHNFAWVMSIPDTITYIGNRCFYRARQLNYLGYKSPTKLEYLGDLAFAECSSLTCFELSLPASIKYVGYSPIYQVNQNYEVYIDFAEPMCFRVDKYYHYELGDIDFETNINNNILCQYKYPDLPRKFNKFFIGGESELYTLLRNIPTLDKLDFTYFGDGSVENPYVCSVKGIEGIEGHVVIPEYVNKNGKEYKVTKLEDGAFENSNIKTIAILGDIEEIPDRCFKGCTKLYSTFVLPNNCKIIGESAFEDCTLLTQCNISSTINKIKPYAFKNTTINEILILLSEAEEGSGKSKWNIEGIPDILEINGGQPVQDLLRVTYPDKTWTRITE